MASFNSCSFSGRVGNDPEAKYLANGNAVSSFSLAVDGRKKDQTMWLKVEVWGKAAQTVADYVKKGSSIIVSGELSIDTWEKDGKTNMKPKLNCSNFTFIGGNDRGGNKNESFSKPAATARQASKQPEPEYDDEIPF